MNLRARLRELYEGRSEAADRFRYGLLAFDLLTVGWLVSTSFLPRSPQLVLIDQLIGMVFLADVMARLWIAPRPLREACSVWGLADFAVVISLLFPIWGEGLAFLRALRLIRVFHSPQTLRQLGQDIPGFRENRETIRAAANLVVFLFVTTGLVYELQHRSNPGIANYADALYFTVTTLSTTGYGDVVLQGTSGRLLSVAVMIVGITLFLRLVQVALRPNKVEHRCPTCGLLRHDRDAVHCKACGTILDIEDEGLD